eukprot:6212225-Pleurochrysis_carterae.AAC.3
MSSPDGGQTGHCSDVEPRCGAAIHELQIHQEKDEDVTAWRSSLLEQPEVADDSGLLDTRVEGALLALNEAIAESNDMQASFHNSLLPSCLH